MGRLRQLLKDKLQIRLHMAAILLIVTLSGALMGRFLLMMGVESMPLRYPVAVFFSYLIFFLMIRLWLWYVSPERKNSSSSSSPDFSAPDGVDVSGVSISLPSTSSAPTGMSGSGGEFGGGGASGSWDSTETPMSAESFRAEAGLLEGVSSGKSSGGGGGISLDVGDGEGAVVIIALGVFAAAVAGVWIYLIYQAPVILTEALFQMLMAAGLFKKVRAMHQGGWMGSVFRATWIPLVIVFALSIALGVFIHYYCPGAVKISQAIHSCKTEP